MEDLKEEGTYDVYLAKYAMYLPAALFGILGVILGRKATSAGVQRQGSVPVAISLIVVAALFALATLGMTGWECWKGSGYPQKWYSWLVIALTIIQRVAFVWFCGSSIYLFRLKSTSYQT